MIDKKRLPIGLGLATATLAALIASSAPANAIEQITVTATRRPNATVQNVPVSVSAYNAQMVRDAGIHDVREVMRLSPSFNFATGQSSSIGTNAYIRGIGTLSDNQGFESSVGFFIDGVYRNRANMAISELPDVKEIEVLRGPQGTLFGRNTTAGAIVVTTAGPEFSPRVFGSATYGNYDDWGTSLGATGPIVPNKLAFRIDGDITQRDGYIKDLSGGRPLNNRNRWFLRGQLLAEPNDDITDRFIVDYDRHDEFCCSGINIVPGPLAPAVDAVAQLYGGIGIVTADPNKRETTVSPGRNLRDHVAQWGVSNELHWKARNDLDLTSITAYRYWSSLRNQDIDFSDMDRGYRQGATSVFRTFTQELRLHGVKGPLDWLLGLYYVNENLEDRDTIRFGTQAAQYVDMISYGLAGGKQLFGSLPAAYFGPPQALITLPPSGTPLFLPPPVNGDGQQADNYRVDTQSISIFTHNEIKLTRQLMLTLGLRFNHEMKDLAMSLNSKSATCDFLLNNPAIAQGLAAASSALLLLACNPEVTTEFNTANGKFISNGAPASASREEDAWSGTAVMSDKFTSAIMGYLSYSRGYKAGGFNLDRGGFAGTLFGGPGPSVSQIEFKPEFVNAYEAGLKTSWFDGRLTANADAFYEDFSDFQLNAFTGINFQVQNASQVISKGVELDVLARPIDGLTLQGGMLYNNAKYGDHAHLKASLAGLEGRQLPQAPMWVFTAGGSYRFPLGVANLDGLFHIDGRWNSAYNTGADLNPLRANKEFAILNARAGILGPDDRWSVEAWVTNLTDQFYSVLSFNVPEQPGTIASYPNQPRMYGVTLRASF